MATKKIRKGVPLFKNSYDDSKKPINLKELFIWVWNESKSELLWLSLAMISSAGFSFLLSLSFLYASNFINAIGRNVNTSELFKIAGALFFIFLGYISLKLIASTLGAVASTNIRRNLEVKCFQHLANLPYEYIEEQSSGRMTSILFAEIPLVSNIVQIILRSFIRAPLSMIMVTAVLCYSSFKIAIIIVFTIPFLFLGMAYFSKLAKKITAKAFKNITEMHIKMQEHTHGIRVIWCLGLINYYIKKMKNISEKVAKHSRQAAIITAIQQIVQDLIYVAILISLLWWLAWQIKNGTIEIGHALLVPAVLIYIRKEVNVLSNGYMQLRKIEGAATKLRELLKIRIKHAA